MHIHVKAVHLGEKPFVCPVENCESKFAYKYLLQRHEKVHDSVYFVFHFSHEFRINHSPIQIQIQDLPKQQRQSI